MANVEIARSTDPETSTTHRILEMAGRHHPHYLVQVGHDGHWIGLGIEDSLVEAYEQIRLRNLHTLEKAEFGRPIERPKGQSSPWGLVHTRTTFAPGIVSVTTAEHGGFVLDREANAQIPEALRSADGSYEEDSGWARVAHAFPHLFTTYERILAKEILINEEPDAYAALTGETVPTERSATLRERAFYAANSGRYIGIAAIADGAANVRVTAVIGGVPARQSGQGEPAKTFRVNAAEYETRREFGFVIDPTRHAEIRD